MTDSIEEIMKGAETMRQKQGYCPFQRTIDDEIRYCSYLNPSLGNPHGYCSHLSNQKVLIKEIDPVGNIIFGEFYKSDFVPMKNSTRE